MSGKCVFVTGTGTDIGKTYITELIINSLRDAGLNAGYYKFAASGVETVPADKFASYVYKEAFSPHLAAKLANRPVEVKVIERDFNDIKRNYDYVTIEGSGGVICPLRWDDEHLILDDVIKRFNLSVIVVADSGLGTINATVLTVEHLRFKNIPIKGLIFNRFDANNLMHIDNINVIAEITGLPIIAKVAENASGLDININALTALYN